MGRECQFKDEYNSKLHRRYIVFNSKFGAEG